MPRPSDDVALPDWTPREGGPGNDTEAVIDLLAVLCLGELTAFERLAYDAGGAPSLAEKSALGAMAVVEFEHHRTLHARLVEYGVDPEEAMAPFVGPLAAFHDGTRPSSWLESLVKAYVGDGIGTDFYRECAAWLGEQDSAIVLEVLSDTGQSAFAVATVRAAIAADPSIAGRLALWARRLVGEALTQAQRVVVERDSLARLIVGGTGDLAGVGRLLSRITDAHQARIAELGLSG